MKLFFILFLIAFNFSSIASDTTYKVNTKNLTRLALKSQTPEFIEKYALYLLKNIDSSEYYHVRKDEIKLKQLITKKKKLLKQEGLNYSHASKFVVSKKVKLSVVNLEAGEIKITGFSPNAYDSIWRKEVFGDAFQDIFFTLYSNMDIFESVQLEAIKLKSFLKENPTKQVFVETILSFPKFQNNHDFQAVIHEIKIYQTEKKQILLATKKETRSSEDLIKNWLLSGGFSNPLVGIHAFSFLGYRAQDLMIGISTLKPYCTKSGFMGRHQVVICEKPQGENALLIITYVGGIVTQLDLVTKNTITLTEKKSLSRLLMLQLNQSKSLFNQKHTKWTAYNTDFTFYSDAFFDKTSNESQFKYPEYANVLLSTTNYTSIISIMSHQTKKFIEENK